MLRFGHDQLSVYGIVREFSREQLKEIIAQLRMKGLLDRNEGDYRHAVGIGGGMGGAEGSGEGDADASQRRMQSLPVPRFER